MTEKELDGLLVRREGNRLEFKESRNGMPKSLFDTVASFLNKEGGIVLLGVDDDGTVSGIEPGKLEHLKKEIITSSNNPQVLNPPFILSPREIEKAGEKLLYLKIPVSSQVHTHKGIIYDRENDSDLRILDNGRKGEVFFRKRTQYTENTIYPALRESDFKKSLFDRSRALIRSRRVDHPWLHESNHNLLRLAGLHRRDFQSGKEGYTLAAALLFGKDEVIQSILPAYKVEAFVRIENQDRYDDRLTLRTNLFDTYSELMGFVRTHLPDKFYLEGEQRKDLRDLIFREVIANIIVHREYTSAEATNIILHSDRIETKNPNKARFRGYLHPDYFQPFPKNPLISKFFIELGWAEEIGSGVKNIHKYLPIYADGNLPVFIEEDSFRIEIPVRGHKIGEKRTQVIEFLNLGQEEIPESVQANLSNIAINRKLAKMDGESDFIYHLAVSWINESRKLDGLRMFTGKKLPSIEEWKDTRKEEKEHKKFGSRLVILISILIRSLDECSMDDLLRFLNYNSRSTFLKNYFNSLLKNGLIEPKYKDRLKHRDQKYIITTKGKRLLGGFPI